MYLTVEKEFIVTEENKNEETIVTTESEVPVDLAEEKIEVDWETLLPTIQAIMQKNEAVSQLGRLLVEAESKTDAFKEKILNANNALQNIVDSLRTEFDVPPGPDWELDLPENEGDPGFFIKKK